MQEQDPILKPIPYELELKSVMAAFVTGAIMKAQTPGFVEDLQEAVQAVHSGIKFSTGKPFTLDERRDIASSTVIHQLAQAWENSEPLNITPTIPEPSNIHSRSSRIFEASGLTLVHDELDAPTIITTIRRVAGKRLATTPVIEAAVSRWNWRGNVPLEVELIADIGAATNEQITPDTAPDFYAEQGGDLTEVHKLGKLKVPQRTISVPFYAQFYEVEHGAKWLYPLLDDLTSIKNKTSN